MLSVRIEAFALAYLFSGECLVVTCVVVLESVFLQILAAAAAVSYIYICLYAYIDIHMIFFEQNCNNLKMAAIGRNM